MALELGWEWELGSALALVKGLARESVLEMELDVGLESALATV